MTKAINRRDLPITPIPGTNKGIKFDNNNKGLRQAACPNCKSANVAPSRGPDGKERYVCGCGAVFKSTRM